MGSLALGVMSDTLGRRPAFLLATMLVLLFGVSTTFATNIWWLVVFRTLVGFGAGGMEVPFDLLGEMINHKENNRSVYGRHIYSSSSSSIVYHPWELYFPCEFSCTGVALID